MSLVARLREFEKELSGQCGASICAEAANEIERLRDALAGLIGLWQLTRNHPDTPASMRPRYESNHRWIEALAALEKPPYSPTDSEEAS